MHELYDEDDGHVKGRTTSSVAGIWKQRKPHEGAREASPPADN